MSFSRRADLFVEFEISLRKRPRCKANYHSYVTSLPTYFGSLGVAIYRIALASMLASLDVSKIVSYARSHDLWLVATASANHLRVLGIVT